MADIPYEHSSRYAWEHFKSTVARIVADYSALDIIEIGGGRAPLFSPSELPENVASYTVNDICARELDLAPAQCRKAHFDICGDLESVTERYDVAFSKMLAEHVRDGARFHANILQLLKPGGTAFHFMPTLYAPPFVLNRLLPETLTRPLVAALFPARNDQGSPKFPAKYSMCYGRSDRVIKKYRSIGYRDVDIRTFYGHDYFNRIPIVRELDHALSRFACRRGISALGTFAYVRLTKAA